MTEATQDLAQKAKRSAALSQAALEAVPVREYVDPYVI